MKILITGASGYIGSVLMAVLEEGGHHVVAATRTNSPFFKRWIFFDLKSSESPRIPEDIDIVIHLAANTLNSNKNDGQEELLAAKLLIDHAKRVSAKFIFLSSQASGEYAYSEYGRTKWKIENEVLAANGIVVRPGLVYGGNGVNGLFGTLVQIVQKRKILPSFCPSPNVQPIHVEDLCGGIVALLKAESRIYSLAAIHPMSFKNFLKEIITTKKIGYRIFIPIPLAVIKMIPFVVTRQSVIRGWVDRLLSLASTVPMHTQDDLKDLNLELRCLSIGMNKRQAISRRELLMEGRLFMLHIGANLNHYSLRRYVKAIELCSNGAPLFLPILLLRIPFLFSLLNLNALPHCLVKADIQWRIDAATLLSEATVKGGARVFGTEHEPTISKIMALMFFMTIRELCRKTLSFLLAPAFKLLLSNRQNRPYV